MGLLSEGTSLTWSDIVPLCDHVREHGIIQFLNIHKRLQGLCNDSLKWGDEVEYIIVVFDEESKRVRLSLRGGEILDKLTEEEREGLLNNTTISTLWRPEYGRFMVEGTPGGPYGGAMKDLLQVEENMRLRRDKVQAVLKHNEAALTITVFPRMGCGVFTAPEGPVYGDVARSLFFTDIAINQHIRFPSLTRNIRLRRNQRVAINIPIFKDKNTPSPFREIFPNDDGEGAREALDDHVYADAMAFGMGNCCLQVTMQACSIDEARLLYDQLAPLTPIMLALTAASPIFRGHLVDTDVRWNMIAQSVDDRTRQERGLEPLTSAPQTLSKSRYESISCYISNDSSLFRPEYNDIPIPTNPKVYKQLSDAGIDHLLAQHMSHLFVRDPLVVFSEKIDQDDSSSSDHFENIQSTNWQTVRFKPPPPHSPIGWRVEFRPMEVSLTDFENAAFTVFTILISRVILSLKLNLYQPISMVDANMARAHSRNAVNTQSFTFRKNIQDTKGGEYAEMSIDTLMNGKEGEFPGFVPLIEQYLDQMEVDYDTRAQINCYLCLIRKRANGSLPSTATYLRDFVTSHPDYAQDSIVSDSIAYDLLRRVDEIGLGQTNCEEITGCCTKRKTE